MSKEQVYELLAKSDKPLRTSEVAEKTGLDKDVVAKAFKELLKEGKIESPVRCCYSAVK